MLAIRLPKDIELRLSQLAQITGRTKTYYAREAILKHLEDLEDRYIAVSRLECSGKRVRHADLEKDLDLDG